MQPASCDFALMRGDDVRVVFDFVDAEGAALSMVGSQVELEVTWSGGGLSLSDAAGLTFDAANGRVEWAATPEQTQAIPAGRIASYALTRIDDDNGRRTYLVGQITGSDGPSAGDVGVGIAVTDGPITITATVAAGGVKGDAGDEGLSAYQVAVANGFVGDKAAWLASLVGPPGATVASGVAFDSAIGGLSPASVLDALLALWSQSLLAALTVNAVTFAPGAAAGTVVATIAKDTHGSVVTWIPTYAADAGKLVVTGSSDTGWKVSIGTGSAVPAHIPGFLVETFRGAARKTRVTFKAALTYVLAAPTLIDAYDADTFTLAGSGATKAVDATRKVQGTGSMQVQAPMALASFTLTGSYAGLGSIDPKTLNTLVFAVSRQTAALTGTSVRPTVQVGAVSATATANSPADASFLNGFRYVSYHVSELPTIYAAANGTLQFKPLVQKPTTAAATYNFDALYSNAGGRPTVVLTFDDGYSTQRDTALPILQARGLLAVCYVPPGLLGTAGKMTVSQVRELRDAGWDLGCDSYSDVNFPSMTVTEAVADLTSVRQWLRDNDLAGAENHMSWPNGVIAQAHADAFAAAGFLTGRGASGNNGTFTRFGIPDGVRLALPWKGAFMNQTIDVLKANIDLAILRGETLIFTFHNVTPTPTAIDISTDVFTQLVDYLKAKRDTNVLDVLTMSELYARDGGASPP